MNFQLDYPCFFKAYVELHERIGVGTVIYVQNTDT